MTAESTTRTVVPGRPAGPTRSGENATGESVSATQTVVAPPDRSLGRLRRAVALTMLALALLAAVRLSFITGLVTPVTIDGPSMAPALLGARYELTCGDCRFPFACGADESASGGSAVCPNCGYAGNALHAEQIRAGERVLIDRWPHLWRGPQRGEIVAARLPGARGPGATGDLVVKRVAAASPEQLTIQDGDLFLEDEIVRKSAGELRDVRQLVHDNDFVPPPELGLPPRWQSAKRDSAWRSAGTGFTAEQNSTHDSPLTTDHDGTRSVPATLDFDWLQYHHWLCTAVPAGRTRDAVVRDNDPYNLEGARELNDVRDLLLTCRVIAEGEGRFALRVQAGDDRFQAVFQPGDTLALERNGQLLSERPLPRGFARRGVDLEFGLCDRQVLLVAEGRTLFRVPYDLADARHRDVLLPLAIGTQGMTLEVSRLQVWRDLYYLEPQKTARPWTAQEPLAAGHYLLLGDNQPASQDGREWLAGVPRSALLGRVYRPFWASR